MTDEVWKRDEVASPCVKTCVIDERNGLCIGCARTRQEIAMWSRMENPERLEIMSELEARAEANKPKRRGGRSHKNEDNTRKD